MGETMCRMHCHCGVLRANYALNLPSVKRCELLGVSDSKTILGERILLPE